MKQILLLAVCLLSLFDNSFGQANGSFYTLQIGKKTCVFKYKERADTLKVNRDSLHIKSIGTPTKPISLQEMVRFKKDTVIFSKTLSLQDTSSKIIHTKNLYAIDTITSINPVTLEENVKIIKQDEASYQIETQMSYFDFLLLLKSKFELKNPQKRLRVYSYSIYYETPDTAGSIYIEYPQTSEGVISKLNCLEKKGGFILLSISEADHGSVKIDTGASFLALIRIKN
jgi:hypothetical protein